jgi:hypothetical protein
MYELRLVSFLDSIHMTMLHLLEDGTAEVICGGYSRRRYSRPSISTRVDYDFDQDNDSTIKVATLGAGWKGGVFAASYTNDVSQLNSIGYFGG